MSAGNVLILVDSSTISVMSAVVAIDGLSVVGSIVIVNTISDADHDQS